MEGEPVEGQGGRRHLKRKRKHRNRGRRNGSDENRGQELEGIDELLELGCSLGFVEHELGVPDSLVPSLRAAVGAIDPEMPLAQIRSLDALRLRSVAAPRFRLSVVSSFAALAVLLAGVGIYGIVSSWASARRREIGIRIAVGADRRSVVRLVSRQGLLRVALGLLAGVATSWMLSRYLKASLFEVDPLSPLPYVVSVLSLAFVGSVASFMPARRAARTDPATVLRSD